MSYPRELTSLPQTGAGVIIDENLAAIRPVAMYARNYLASTGLTLGYYGGHIAGTDVADGTIALDASQANVYVVAHRTTGVVSKATTTTNWDATSTYGRLFRATTSGSAITDLDDWREQAGGWFDRAAAAGVVDADDVTYTPTTLADWDGSADPGDVEQALDQLAERVTDIEGAGSSPSVAARYTIDLASQADSDPGAGKLRFNHASPASATKIFLDDETSDGVDMSTALLDLGSSGYIRIQSALDVGEWLLAKWTAITDDTGYFDIAITVLATKGTLDDTDAALVTFDAKGSGGGSTQGRHSIPIAPGSWYADQTAPPLWAGSNGASDQPDTARWSFDPTTEQAVWTVIQLPKKWNAGTITYDLTWFRGAGSNPTVVWSLRAVAFGDGDAVAANYGTAQAVTDTGATAGNFYRTPESSALTIAGTPQDHDLVFLELSRKPGDASDTFDANAELEMVTLYITTDADTDA